jgi:hypothetical protein
MQCLIWGTAAEAEPQLGNSVIINSPRGGKIPDNRHGTGCHRLLGHKRKEIAYYMALRTTQSGH